jgi:Holliday junction resolvase RusA-like endonuclease
VVPGKGFATITENPATRAAEKALVEELLPLAPPVAWEGAIRMDVTFVFVPPLKPRWQYEAAVAGFIHPTGDNLGDRDNLHKLLADAMEKAGFYVKDSRLVKGLVEKAYGDEPGYRVRMELIPEPKTFEEWKTWKR